MQHHAVEAFVDVYNLIEMHGFLWGRPPPLLPRGHRCFRSGGSSVANDVMIGRYDAEGQDFFSALVDTTPSAPRIVFSSPPPNDSDDDDGDGNDDDDHDDDDEEEKYTFEPFWVDQKHWLGATTTSLATYVWRATK